MRLNLKDASIEIKGEDGGLAGRYVVSDVFKPYLHPLSTPSGIQLSVFMPHDHKHHRGLMYALRTLELNFWEERATNLEERVGRQVHQELLDIVEVGDTVGFTQKLVWCATDDECPVFLETRRLTCSMGDDGRSYVWTWHTSLDPQSDLTLRMSQWSSPRSDGSLVNYHGLGLRLRREFSGEIAKVQMKLDGRPVVVSGAHGEIPTSVEFGGAVDGYWPIRYAGVRVAQQQSNSLFIMKDPFAYIALGPSNDRQRSLKRGETIEEDYTITVFDADAPDT